MKNRWNEQDLETLAGEFAPQPRVVNRDVVELVYASRLLGQNPKLVLHGGGNTSVKTKMLDVTGQEIDVVCVKGSGWDLGDIEPQGLPALRLEALCAVAQVDTLSDEDMVNALRCNLLNNAAPTPSVETLLHATLPYKFVLHTHANAVVSLTDQPDGEQLSRELYGDLVTHIPYVMPGFVLAKAVLNAKCGPRHQGMILINHGVFSFGETARQAYDIMIDLVTRAEERLAENRKSVESIRFPIENIAGPELISPILRGATALHDDATPAPARPFIVMHRTNDRIRDYLARPDLDRISQIGVATPDHVIRTKQLPVLLEAPAPNALVDFATKTRASIDAYTDAYGAYFQRHDQAFPGQRDMLDPMPRVVLVRGSGLYTLGKTTQEANVIADLAETTMDVITDAEAIGRYVPVDEAQTFEVEYWSLEQAKLKQAIEKPFTRRVVVITGGAGAIGLACGEAFAKLGAEVVLLDLDETRAKDAAQSIGGLGLACDVTQANQVTHTFDKIASSFGGIDVVISNAGAAWQGRIGDVDDKTLRKSFELNFFAHQTVARHAVRLMRRQGFGGSLLFNVSKQAVNPGRDFGPYGLPKAATMALVRQYAVDYGDVGIRSNGVNADRVRSGIVTDEMIKNRSKARNVTQEQYMSGNLLGREVLAKDVAQAFVDLALASKTTGAIMTVDGGNIAAALR
ncbi:MAG: bifunctional aldolase/short-chain dehydrogenase [Planctomycetota bacterium]|nr:bifunctional aldolase/short-chain dehydrogenase [Planctomycetota bacterium]